MKDRSSSAERRVPCIYAALISKVAVQRLYRRGDRFYSDSLIFGGGKNACYSFFRTVFKVEREIEGYIYVYGRRDIISGPAAALYIGAV